jgi:mRNA-degrading endonuclease toxin of MazEF toxin-antitoxin module
VRYSDIHLKKIYYVNFNPVRQCEFDGKHLAVVLKKNNDSRTVVVAPLTTSSNGIGKNKIELGYLSVLPQALRSQKSYLVYNQIRTVNCNRFTKVIYASNLVPDLKNN